MNRGFIKLWRCLEDDEFHKDHVFFTFWVTYCLLRTAWEDKVVKLRGATVELKRGQFIFGRKKAAEFLGVSEKVIRRCIELCKTLGMVSVHKRASTHTVYNVMNWETYQPKEEEEGQHEGHQKGQHEGTVKGHDLRSKEDQEVKKRPKPPAVEIPESLQTDSFKTAWTEFEEYRKENRLKPYKPRGRKQLFKKLAEWGEPRAVAAIYYSMRQTYQGIYEEKGGNGKHQTKSTAELGREMMLEAAEREANAGNGSDGITNGTLRLLPGHPSEAE